MYIDYMSYNIDKALFGGFNRPRTQHRSCSAEDVFGNVKQAGTDKRVKHMFV